MTVALVPHRAAARLRRSRPLAALLALGAALVALTGCTNLMPGAEADASALAAEAEAIGLVDVSVEASMMESVVPYLQVEATAPPELDRDVLAEFLVQAPESDTTISSMQIALDDGTDVRDLKLSIDAGHDPATVVEMLQRFEASPAGSLQLGDTDAGDLSFTVTVPAETFDEAIEQLSAWASPTYRPDVDLADSVVHAGGISVILATADAGIAAATGAHDATAEVLGVSPQVVHRPPRPELEANPHGYLEIGIPAEVDAGLAQTAADAVASFVRDELGTDTYRLVVTHGDETLLELGG